jgi:hypothetical protein
MPGGGCKIGRARPSTAEIRFTLGDRVSDAPTHYVTALLQQWRGGDGGAGGLKVSEEADIAR